MSKRKKKMGRPYELTIEDHRDLIRRHAAKQPIRELMDLYKLGIKAIYAYVRRNPDERCPGDSRRHTSKQEDV